MDHLDYLPTTTVVDIDSLTLWEENPMDNDDAVPAVAESIKEFGFIHAVVVDEFNVVKAGNTRVKAARFLGLRRIPVIRAEHLTASQLNSFAVADNATGRISKWNYDKLVALTSLEDLREIPGITGQDMERVNSYLLKKADIDKVKENSLKGTSKIQHKCPQCSYEWTA